MQYCEFSQYQKYNKTQFIIYADLECLIKNIDGCKNNPENSSTTKVGEHGPSGFSRSTKSSFKSTENKHDVYMMKLSTRKRLHEKVLRILKSKRN